MQILDTAGDISDQNLKIRNGIGMNKKVKFIFEN